MAADAPMLNQSRARPTKIGWIGTGSMGLAMALNLQKHLAQLGAPSLKYYNRTASRAAPLQQIGGVPCSDAQQLVMSTDICFISLSDDGALMSTIDAILHDVRPQRFAGKIIVDTSTVHPETSSKVDLRLREQGIQFVAAPVFGASPVAAKGELLWVVGGNQAAIQTISPYLTGVMARGVIHVGEEVKNSSMIKTAGNFLTAGMMELIAEALVLVEKTGASIPAFEMLLKEQYGPLAFNISQRLGTGAYMPKKGDAPWSSIELAVKDVGHGIDCAEQVGVELPVAEAALQHVKEAKKYGDDTGRALDSSSLYGSLRRRAGLSFETDLVKARDDAAAKDHNATSKPKEE